MRSLALAIPTPFKHLLWENYSRNNYYLGVSQKWKLFESVFCRIKYTSVLSAHPLPNLIKALKKGKT